MLAQAVTLYASFDEQVAADFGGGTLTLSTRSGPPTDRSKWVFEAGHNASVFRIAKDKGISGGALEVVDVLPNNGRIFFPAKGNIAYKKGGWGGAVSYWVKTDPDAILKTPFCDPVQITQNGANDGGIWVDFNKAMPRDLRMGMFSHVPDGHKPISEDDPKAPMIRVSRVGFKQTDWHHIVMSWDGVDSGMPATARLYIDGKLIGTLNEPIAMGWDIDKTGIYVAVNYIGLLDEFAVFSRALTEAEVTLLHGQPGVLGTLKTRGLK